MGFMDDATRGGLVRARSAPTPDQHYSYAMTEDRLSLIVVGICFTLIGTFAVACRAAALAKRRRKIGYDDYSMFAAYLCSIGFTIASYISVRWGVGLKVGTAPASWAANAVKAVYVIEIFYYFSIYLIKMSIVFLYLRLAAELQNHFYKGTVLLGIILTLHFTTTIIVAATQCIPMTKYWDPTTPGSCISITAFFYSTNVFTIITDLFMLALPVTTVWQVRRPKSQKIGIVAAFLCGGLTTLASCIRLYSVRIYTESKEPMRDAAPINTWSFIEIDVGILCASVAVMKQLFLKTGRGGSVSTSQRDGTNNSSTMYASYLSRSSKKSEPMEVDEMSRMSSRMSALKGEEHVLEAGRDANGQPIRQSLPLPPSPVAKRYEPKLPAQREQPILDNYMNWDHSGGDSPPTNMNMRPTRPSPGL